MLAEFWESLTSHFENTHRETLLRLSPDDRRNVWLRGKDGTYSPALLQVPPVKRRVFSVDSFSKACESEIPASSPVYVGNSRAVALSRDGEDSIEFSYPFSSPWRFLLDALEGLNFDQKKLVELFSETLGGWVSDRMLEAVRSMKWTAEGALETDGLSESVSRKASASSVHGDLSSVREFSVFCTPLAYGSDFDVNVTVFLRLDLERRIFYLRTCPDVLGREMAKFRSAMREEIANAMPNSVVVEGEP